MERVDLLRRLRTIEPALATRDHIPVLTHVAIQGGNAIAFDDVLALKIPCGLAVEGCFPGRTLIDFLSAASARTIEVLDAGNNEAVLKMGRSKLTLSRSADTFPLFGSDDEPNLKEAAVVPITQSMVDALERAAVCTGQDSLQLWSYGVTVAWSSKKPTHRFLSTNNFSIAESTFEAVSGKAPAAILPPRFVDVFLKEVKRGPAKKLYIWDTWVAATFENGATLYCRTVPEADPAQFDTLLGGLQGKGPLVQIPQRLEGSLTRSKVFLTSPVIAEREATFRVTEKGKLYIEVQSSTGKMQDAHSFDGHPALKIKAPPELILAALPHVEKIGFVEGKCVRMEGDGFRYVVSGTV